MIEKSIKQGESLRIGFAFNPEYDETRINDLLMYIDGVLVGRKSFGTINKLVYWTVSMSGDDTFSISGQRDLILIIEDSKFGLRKFVVAGLLFDRLADEFHANIENEGYNLILNLTIDETVLTSDITLLEAIKGDKGDPGGGAMIGGGLKDQVLTKLSDTNLDAGWIYPIPDRHFTFEQKTPSLVWMVNHSLNKYPSIAITDSAHSVVEGQYNYIDKDNLIITFSVPFMGFAELN